MPRTIVYDDPAVQVEMVKELRAQPRRRVGIAPVAHRKLRRTAEEQAEGQSSPHDKIRTDGVASKDGYLAKIGKYVPAEIVTLTTLGFAAFSPHGASIWLWLALGALVNVVYLFGAAVVPRGFYRPRWFFYVLSVGAYFLWAMAVIDVVKSQAGLTGDVHPGRRRPDRSSPRQHLRVGGCAGLQARRPAAAASRSRARRPDPPERARQKGQRRGPVSSRPAIRPLSSPTQRRL